MAAKEKEEAPAEAAALPPKKSKKKLIIIIVVLLLVGGGGAAFLMGGSKPEEKTEESDAPKVFKTITLEPIVVNLTEAKSFLKVAMMLEYDEALLHKLTAGAEGGGAGHGGGGSGGEAADPGGFPAAMTEKVPRIKDRIIAVLSAKTPNEVLSVSGKQALKDEILEGINEVIELPEPVIVAVYFTEFIVQ